MKKKIYRTVIKLVVLSEEPIDDNLDMGSIWEETQNGEFLAGEMTIGKGKAVVGKSAVIEVEKAGSDAEFFRMDAEGNDLEDEDDED
jgi:hypothetical protein